MVGGLDDGPAALIYDQIEILACRLWQQTGCQFGLYQDCCEQARAQLLAAGRQDRGRAKKETAKLKPRARAGRS